MQLGLIPKLFLVARFVLPVIALLSFALPWIIQALPWIPSAKTRRFSWSDVVFIFWFLLLIPRWVFAGLSGMAFDQGHVPRAYVFYWSIWTYPIAVMIAGALARKVAALVWLPFLNLVGFCISGFTSFLE